MNKKKYSLLFLTLLALILVTRCDYGQTIYVPVENGIYNYLSRLSVKNIIHLDDESKPYSRIYIAELLKEISLKESNLNTIEIEELKWYKQDYSYELGIFQKQERWYLYSHTDSLFSVKAMPKIGGGVSMVGGKSGYTKWPGISLWGSYDKVFSASFSYVDKGEYGNDIDTGKIFTPVPGAWYKTSPSNFEKGIEYSDVMGSISLSWKWGSFSLIKDYMEWGHGQFGQLILSNKAPSFPHIRLELKPAEWLRFYYMHGWLNSLVLDSSSFYYSHTNWDKWKGVKEKYVNKYIAANMLTITPYDWLDVSLGNSYVYSGDPRPEMFIPFMYYKVMDHNTGREGIDDGNGEIFLDVKFNYIKNLSLYSTLLIDVLEIAPILKNEWYKSWFGYTLGAHKVDFMVQNLDFMFEYTKIGPWVYENKDATTTYKHLNYSLGHWLGQNADQLRFQFNYKIKRGLDVLFYGERIRKGGLNDLYYAYVDRINFPFLYGPQRIDLSLGLEGKYEPIHDLYIRMNFKFSNIKDDDPSRTPGYLLGNKNSFGFFIMYGI